MEKLVAYLLENLIIDFKGELSLEQVRDYLRNDDSALARRLLSKIVADGGVDEMMLTLADCLQEQVASGINPQVVAEQLKMYVES